MAIEKEETSLKTQPQDTGREPNKSILGSLSAERPFDSRGFEGIVPEVLYSFGKGGT